MLMARFVGAEVTKVDIAQRTAIGASGYEKLVGTVHFAIDPKDARNRVIADLDKAAVNAQGKVEFSSAFYLIRPVDRARSNGVALVEVSNRGRKGLLGTFSRAAASLDPQTDADLGDGFLTRQGFTLAWVGWQFDVKPDGGLMTMKAPMAQNTSLVVRAEFIPNDRGPSTTVADLGGYPPSDVSGSDTRLTMRDDPFGQAQTVDRAKYTVAGNVVTMRDGFEPGRIYELAYKTANPAIAGAGMAAFRDFAAWLKHGQTDGSNAKYTYAWGSSQSGRFLRTFLYYGFNADEKGGQVFDGVMAHIAGAARLSLNERSATPNALSMFSATGFPFANIATTRSHQRPHRRAARQRPRPAVSAEDLLHEHVGGVLGWRPIGGAHSHRTGRQVGPHAARQRSRLLPDRRAARTGAVPDARHARAAARESGRVRVDVACAADGDGPLGP